MSVPYARFFTPPLRGGSFPLPRAKDVVKTSVFTRPLKRDSSKGRLGESGTQGPKADQPTLHSASAPTSVASRTLPGVMRTEGGMATTTGVFRLTWPVRNTDRLRRLAPLLGMPLYPLAGQPLGLGNLFASQPPLDYVFVALRSLISLGCRES